MNKRFLWLVALLLPVIACAVPVSGVSKNSVSDYAAPLTATETAQVIGTITGSVNLRDAPEGAPQGSNVMEVLIIGDTVEVIGCDDFWCRVSHDGRIGWMRREWMDVNTAESLYKP